MIYEKLFYSNVQQKLWLVCFCRMNIKSGEGRRKYWYFLGTTCEDSIFQTLFTRNNQKELSINGSRKNAFLASKAFIFFLFDPFRQLLENVHEIRVRQRMKMFKKSWKRQNNFYFIRFHLLTYVSLFPPSQLTADEKREDVKSLPDIHTHARHEWRLKSDVIWMMVWYDYFNFFLSSFFALNVR